jgi:circadian clock protein KaiB
MEKKSVQKQYQYKLQLYVSGMSSKSMIAISNVKHFCEQYIKDDFELSIIDIYKNPELAVVHQIVFSPSLIKLLPLPKKTLIGNFADTEKVKRALGVTT